MDTLSMLISILFWSSVITRLRSSIGAYKVNVPSPPLRFHSSRIQTIGESAWSGVAFAEMAACSRFFCFCLFLRGGGMTSVRSGIEPSVSASSRSVVNFSRRFSAQDIGTPHGSKELKFSGQTLSLIIRCPIPGSLGSASLTEEFWFCDVTSPWDDVMTWSFDASKLRTHIGGEVDSKLCL